MAVRSSTPSDLIIIDSNYLSRIQLRRELIRDHPHHVVGSLPCGADAVRETYAYVRDFLLARYPTLFSRDDDKGLFRNHVTGQSLPLELPPPAAGGGGDEDAVATLKLLAEMVEDDLFLLRATPEGHQCVALLCCFPSGFDPAEKLGKVLKDIHGPVPLIGASMERFFGRLEVGKSVVRNNWSVNLTPELFNVATNHIKDGDAYKEDVDVDISKAYVRVELQTLTRLPKTQAILFSFKTYLYPVTDIKAEGLGPEVADAIEGLPRGNAPGMWKYKGGVRWGKSICAYLRS
ncbi:hypothetical protein PG985_006309 [Apiospora marii]|uniref:uncharacterized protein n=1 Tax=Apiospora marii TaxID=335849 RepID=UPI00312F8F3B